MRIRFNDMGMDRDIEDGSAELPSCLRRWRALSVANNELEYTEVTKDA